MYTKYLFVSLKSIIKLLNEEFGRESSCLTAEGISYNLAGYNEFLRQKDHTLTVLWKAWSKRYRRGNSNDFIIVGRNSQVNDRGASGIEN